LWCTTQVGGWRVMLCHRKRSLHLDVLLIECCHIKQTRGHVWNNSWVSSADGFFVLLYSQMCAPPSCPSTPVILLTQPVTTPSWVSTGP
jgi:hypothetical protein